MYKPAARLAQLRHLLTVLVVVAIVGGGLLIGLGAAKLGEPRGLWLIVVGAGVVAASVAGFVVTFILLKIDANVARVSTAIRDLYEQVERYDTRLEAIAESARLSDAAKSIAHRLEDRAALRAAIRSEIAMNDWEAAMALITEMEQRFGYKEEAQQLRDQVSQACRRFYHEEVDKALPDFSLLARKFRKSTPAPSFKGQWDKKLKKFGKGLTIITSGQCPHNAKMVNDIVEIAKDRYSIEPRIVEYKSYRQAQNAPGPYAVAGLVYDGKLVADHTISGTRFRLIMEREIGIDARKRC